MEDRIRDDVNDRDLTGDNGDLTDDGGLIEDRMRNNAEEDMNKEGMIG